MMKAKRIKMLIGLFLVGLTAFGAACGAGPQTARTPRIKPDESPTPEYKPLKRVSRDVIKSETKDDAVKIKAAK